MGFQTTVTQEEWGIGRSWRVPLEPPLRALRAEPCVKLILAAFGSVLNRGNSTGNDTRTPASSSDTSSR